MRKSLLMFLLAVVSLSANAGLIQLDADSASSDDPISRLSDFTIIFDDLDGNSLFSLSELSSFSGFTLQTGITAGGMFSPTITEEFDSIATVPDVAGFTEGAGPRWGFLDSSGAVGSIANPTLGVLTYSLTRLDAPEPSPAPAPASIALLGLGLLGLRLRRK